MEEVQRIKQRFGIIGNTPALNDAIDLALRVAHTDLSILITGESGVGKEVFSQIIHQNSPRKHGPYLSVNCGAIPDGTVESELFGHEKSAFTDAKDLRKGYFEVTNGGTIFLDEVAELPLAMQTKLLRVLEYGDYMRVGASVKSITNVRVISATNVNIVEYIARGKFREDLYYRLNGIQIDIPALRERANDIYLLFRKFSLDFAEKYKIPAIQLTSEAQAMLTSYYWPGNVRQMKNIAERISVVEHKRNIDADTLKLYLTKMEVAQNLPVWYQNHEEASSFATERALMCNLLFDMQRSVSELNKIVAEMRRDIDNSGSKNFGKVDLIGYEPARKTVEMEDTEEVVDESLSLFENEAELIKKALDKYDGRRRNAAQELGISERTLYRKIKDYDLE